MWFDSEAKANNFGRMCQCAAAIGALFGEATAVGAIEASYKGGKNAQKAAVSASAHDEWATAYDKIAAESPSKTPQGIIGDVTKQFGVKDETARKGIAKSRKRGMT